MSGTVLPRTVPGFASCRRTSRQAQGEAAVRLTFNTEVLRHRGAMVGLDIRNTSIDLVRGADDVAEEEERL